MILNKIPSLRNFSSLTIMLLVTVLMLGGMSCKSKKKAMEASRIAQEKAKLEQEMALKKQREEEERMRKEAEDRQLKEEEARARARTEVQGPAAKLDNYFNAIAQSGNVASANSSINEALSLFSSPDTPVLIVISEVGGERDYDKPTTIKNYLNYLKDQKKSINKISNLQFDSSGKITEVELVKQK